MHRHISLWGQDAKWRVTTTERTTFPIYDDQFITVEIFEK